MEDFNARFAAIVGARFAEARLSDLAPALRKRLDELRDDQGAIIWGKPGRGKTHTMAAMAYRYLVQGYAIRFLTFEWFALLVRDIFKPNATESEADMVKPFCMTDVLFLDDVGTTVSTDGQESDFSLRLLMVVLDTRLRECLPTFITSNKSVEQLGATFDDRVASRLLESGIVIHATGEDRRKTEAESCRI